MPLSYPEFKPLTSAIIHGAIEVHRHLGPGLLEHIYEEALYWELVDKGMAVQRQSLNPIVYKSHVIPGAYRLDMVVNDTVVIEVKAVERVLPVHRAQLLTYLKITQRHVGLLLNFNTEQMRQGIFRVSL
ncbi:MAG TPA: GxxExxY protein [Gemmatimonadaceae bacterium]